MRVYELLYMVCILFRSFDCHCLVSDAAGCFDAARLSAHLGTTLKSFKTGLPSWPRFAVCCSGTGLHWAQVGKRLLLSHLNPNAWKLFSTQPAMPSTYFELTILNSPRRRRLAAKEYLRLPIFALLSEGDLNLSLQDRKQ